MNECSSPNFVSGLIQADGVSTRSFFIAFEKIKQSKLGLNAPSQKSLYLSSKSALEAVQAFFKGIGKIDDNAKKHSAELVIDSLYQLRHLIIPHFYQFTNKAIHDSRLKQVVNLVKSERAYEIEWLPEAGVYAAHATLGCHTSPPKGVGGG